MANYADTYYEEVDALLQSLRPNPFGDTPLPDPVPQVEQTIGPAGWVENADGSDGEATVLINADGITVLDGKINVINGSDTIIENGVVRRVENEGADVTIDENGITVLNGRINVFHAGDTVIDEGVVRRVENVGADVTIDADGITILNGAITLQDLGGQSVLSAAGFGGSWVNFIADRMYNSMFAYGTINTDFSVSETGGADTEQEYQDSISTELPYWIVGSATATARLISDSTASYGRALQVSGAAGNLYIYQDVPVTPGNYYTMLMTWKYANSASEFSRVFRLSWRDSTRAIIGTEQEDGLAYTTSQSAYLQDEFGFWESAPNNAAYLRVGFEIDQTSGSPTVTIADVKMYEASFYGEKFHMRNDAETAILNGMVIGDDLPMYVLNASGTMQWGPGGGSGIDVQLARGDVGVLEVATTGGGGAFKIRGNPSTPGRLIFGDTDTLKLRQHGSNAGTLQLEDAGDNGPGVYAHIDDLVASVGQSDLPLGFYSAHVGAGVTAGWPSGLTGTVFGVNRSANFCFQLFASRTGTSRLWIRYWDSSGGAWAAFAAL